MSLHRRATEPTLYDRHGRSYRRWQINEQDWPKPGMFRNWKTLGLAVGCFLAVALMLVVILRSLGC